MKTIVRVSLAPLPGTLPMVLVQSSDDVVRIVMPINAPLLARLNGRSRAYFWLEDKAHEVEIGEEVPGQDW